MSTSDTSWMKLDSMLGNPAPTLAAPAATPAATSAPVGGGFDKLDQSLGLNQPAAKTPAAPAEPEFFHPVSVADGMGALDKQLGLGAAQLNPASDRKKDYSMSVEEPWYSRTWDYLNKPLFDLHREGAGPIESGVEDVITGLTSPLSLALTVGTFGGGAIEGIGVGALTRLGVAEASAPAVLKGMTYMMNAGFTIEQVKALTTQVPQVLDALKEGDYDTAKRLGTSSLIGASFAALGANHMIKGAGALREAGEAAGIVKPNAELAALKSALGEEYLKPMGISAAEAKQTIEAARKEFAGIIKPGEEATVVAGAIRKYLAAGGDPELLKLRHDALAGTLQTREETPEEKESLRKAADFRQWFGSSVMKDPEGNPIVAYHGSMSPKDIEEWTQKAPPELFTPEGEVEPEMLEPGEGVLHPSSDPNAYLGPHFAVGKGAQTVANHFAEGGRNAPTWLQQRRGILGDDYTPKVYPVHLKIDKLMDFGPEQNMSEFISKGFVTDVDALESAMVDQGIDIHGLEDGEFTPEEEAEIEKETQAWEKEYKENEDFRVRTNKWITSEVGHFGIGSHVAEELADSARERLLAEGYDGIKYKNNVEGGEAVIPIKDASKQVHFAIEETPAKNKAYEPVRYMYRAVRPDQAEEAMKFGIKGGTFHPSPEDALEHFKANEPQEPGSWVYGVRDVGTTGLPTREGAAHLTFDEAQARKWQQGFGSVHPQEIVKLNLQDLKPEDYERVTGADKSVRVKTNKYIPESKLDVLGEKVHPRVFAVPENEVLHSAVERDVIERGVPVESVGVHKPIHEELLDEEGNPSGERGAVRESRIAVPELEGPTDEQPDFKKLSVLGELTNEGFQKKYTAAEKAELLSHYEKAMDLSDEQKAFADKLKDSFNQDAERAYQHGVIREFLDHYITNQYRPEDIEGNAAISKLKHQSNMGAFDTNLPYAKHRIYQTEFEAEMLGRKPVTTRKFTGLNPMGVEEGMNPLETAAKYRHDLNRVIASRNFLEAIRDKNLRASDGRALVALAGNGKVLGEESGNPMVAVNPRSMRSPMIADSLAKELLASGEMKQLIDQGKVVRFEDRKNFDPAGNPQEPTPQFGWSHGDYAAIDHPSMRGWNYVTQDTAGKPVFMQGELRVHPEAEKFLRTAIGADKSIVRQLPGGTLALKGGAEAKHLLLSLSPFHIVQEGLRAVMTGINPFSAKFADVLNDTELQAGLKHGLTLYKDYRGLDDYTEGIGGNSAIINRVPGLRNLQAGMQKFLFEDYIPSLKARAYKALVDRYRRAGSINPMSDAAAHTNEVFGGLNYKLLGRSTSTQDMMRLGLLAPDWLESEVRFLKRSIGGSGMAGMKVAMQDNARIAAYTFAAARVLNMLVSGKPHAEAPFGVVQESKNGKEDVVYSFRTLPTDLMHAASDPVAFVRGRLNPLTARTAAEAIQGRDEFGRRVPAGQQIADLAKNITPIAAQSGIRRMFGGVPDLSNPQQVAKAAGASVYKYRTEAEKAAMQLASDRMPTGPVDSRELATHVRNIHLEDALRNGEIQPGQILAQLGRREAQTIIRQSKMSPLEARFARLPMKDAMHVWDVATPGEKELLHAAMWKKRAAYMKEHPPAERANDPTWQMMRRVYPDLGR